MYLKDIKCRFNHGAENFASCHIALLGPFSADSFYHRIGLNFDLLLIAQPRVCGESFNGLSLAPVVPPI